MWKCIWSCSKYLRTLLPPPPRPAPFPDCYRRRTKQGTLDLFLRRMSSLHGILTWDSCTWLVVSEFQQKCISIFQHWLQIPGSILIKELMGLDRCSFLVIFVLFFLFQFLKRKYNARDFDKSKAANLLKIMKGNIPPRSGRIAALKCCA